MRRQLIQGVIMGLVCLWGAWAKPFYSAEMWRPELLAPAYYAAALLWAACTLLYAGVKVLRKR